MKIIDRNKDYYDYLSHVYGVDGNIAFDRRGSVLLTDRYIREFAAANALQYSRYFGFDALLLEAGFTHYMFLIEEKASVEIAFELKHAFTSAIHFSARPLCLYFTHSYKITKDYFQQNRKARRFSYDNVALKKHMIEIKFRNGAMPVCIELPILDKTSLKSLIKAEDIWKSIYNYLCKTQEPKIVDTRNDIAKAIDHGFDQKTSFRHPVK
jgi:hypothetical protein